jgi:type IV pilus assembly protein PilA
MKLNRSKKGFTLVEIMIVVVIIGLLAAMAIPAFQKVRRSSIGKAMANDARQIGAAMQQIALEYPADTGNGVAFTIGVDTQGNLTNAVLGGITANKITEYVSKISRGTNNPGGAAGTIVYTFGGITPAVPATNVAFTLTNAQVAPVDVIASSTFAGNLPTVAVGQPVSFDQEGKAL